MCVESSRAKKGWCYFVLRQTRFRIASFDNPDLIEPDADVWTKSAVKWDPLHPTLPKFEGQIPDDDLMELIANK